MRAPLVLRDAIHNRGIVLPRHFTIGSALWMFSDGTPSCTLTYAGGLEQFPNCSFSLTPTTLSIHGHIHNRSYAITRSGDDDVDDQDDGDVLVNVTMTLFSGLFDFLIRHRALGFHFVYNFCLFLLLLLGCILKILEDFCQIVSLGNSAHKHQLGASHRTILTHRFLRCLPLRSFCKFILGRYDCLGVSCLRSFCKFILGMYDCPGVSCCSVST